MTNLAQKDYCKRCYYGIILLLMENVDAHKELIRKSRCLKSKKYNAIYFEQEEEPLLDHRTLIGIINHG